MKSLALGIMLSRTTVSATPPAPPIIDLSTLDFSSLWNGSYAGSGYHSTASAGTSGAKILTTVGVAPSIGAPVNGHTPMVFNGTTQSLWDDTRDMSTYLTRTAGRLLIVYSTVVAPAPSGGGATPFNDPTLFCEHGANLGFTNTSAGFGAMHAPFNPVAAAPLPADGNFHLADYLFDGSSVSISVNAGAPVTGASANTGALAGGIPLVGRNYDGSHRFTGSILMLATSQVTLAGSLSRAQAKAYVNDRYALSL